MTDEELVDALKALAHPVRLRIVQTLAGTERNVGEIDEAADIGQPTLSQQLAVLRNAGLVKTRKDAKLVYYRLNDDRLGQAAQVLGEVGGQSGGSVRHARRPAPGVANFAKLGSA
jgi:DNA-binding transcriptional ArsR family regulator